MGDRPPDAAPARPTTGVGPRVWRHRVGVARRHRGQARGAREARALPHRRRRVRVRLPGARNRGALRRGRRRGCAQQQHLRLSETCRAASLRPQLRDRSARRGLRGAGSGAALRRCQRIGSRSARPRDCRGNRLGEADRRQCRGRSRRVSPDHGFRPAPGRHPEPGGPLKGLTMNTLRQIARARLRGALLGLTTPFTSAGTFDEETFRRNVEFYIEHGFQALVVAGTYGEVTALTQDERQHVIRAAVEQARGRAAILADTHHVGSLDEVIAITRHAEAVGADYAYVLTPYYFRPSDEGLLAFYRRVAAATRIPIVLYTYGWRTHVRIKPEVVRALLDCETIVAIKAADPDISDLSDLIALVGDELAISCGWEVHAIHGAA